MPDFVFCADDFTGASDTLATLTRNGLTSRLYLRSEDLAANPDIQTLDAVGIASSLRSMSQQAAVGEMNHMGANLARIGGRFHHLKVCSTFDSSPDIGNLCATADAYSQQIEADWTAVIGGQPSLGRYCIFGHLFAADSNGVIHRIDRHPVMRTHPITPMQESDLRLHFRQQGWLETGLVDITSYRRGATELAAELRCRIADGETRTLFDVSADEDLQVIGLALQTLSDTCRILSVGSSSVAQALSPLCPGTIDPQRHGPHDSLIKGPVLAFAGSRSTLTSQQVEAALDYVKLELEPSDLIHAPERDRIIRQGADILAMGSNLLLYLSANTGHLLSGRELALATGTLLDAIVSQSAIGLLAIAGGDTSSIAVQTMDIDCLSFIGDFERGVPLIRAHSYIPNLNELPMILKGGQMGTVDIFNRIAALAGEPR
ncbi:four-carbon acid sugar kinase family protein [Marinobacterium rhizophilum]|uniref:four-carbon acid sugar kinase family protein n=1 Tax=Marinobacterium rhizophilum TaxID=420402 RepID=UPI00036C5C72|nr:four-carbon acid sugar kinase family protein [Marinobacterium rhizophilum]